MTIIKATNSHSGDEVPPNQAGYAGQAFDQQHGEMIALYSVVPEGEFGIPSMFEPWKDESTEIDDDKPDSAAAHVPAGLQGLPQHEPHQREDSPELLQMRARLKEQLIKTWDRVSSKSRVKVRMTR